MKNPYHLLFILATILLNSCSSKEDDNNPSLPSSSLIKTVKYSSPSAQGYTSTYVYDIHNRVRSIASTEGDSLNFSHNGNEIHTIYTRNGTILEDNYYFLDSQGLIDTAIETSADYTYLKFKYDAQRYLIQLKAYFNSGIPEDIYNYTIENGNVISEIGTDENGTIVSMQTTSFDLTTFKTTAYDNTGQPFRGKSSKNLPTRVDNSHGTIHLVYDYSYTFDGSGRVKSVVIKSGATVVKEEEYTYY